MFEAPAKHFVTFKPLVHPQSGSACRPFMPLSPTFISNDICGWNCGSNMRLVVWQVKQQEKAKHLNEFAIQRTSIFLWEKVAFFSRTDFLNGK
jgi:hypothetical protein